MLRHSGLESMVRKPPKPDAADPLEVYRRAVQAADADTIHELIAEQGPDVLKSGLPYLIVSARWRLQDRFRKETRRKELLAEHQKVAELPTNPSWDPMNAVSRSESLTALVGILARLPDEDVLAVWRHMEGVSDSAENCEGTTPRWLQRMKHGT